MKPYRIRMSLRWDLDPEARARLAAITADLWPNTLAQFALSIGDDVVYPTLASEEAER